MASSGAVENGTDGWVGNLSSLDISNMYAIQMASATTVTLRGSRASVTEVPINLTNGWNWIGYPVNYDATVEYALSNYTPQNGDLIKGTNGASEYDAQSGSWIGNLPGLQPGIGYMLKASTSSSFTYPAVPASGRGLLTPQYDNVTEWQPVMASHPYNMNMIAVVTLNNEELRSDNIEIGVFNGETCRGAVRPIYVDVLDQYLVFLTMYGENNEPYSFRMLDKETGNVYESNEASISFKADAVIGGVRAPFALNFNSKNSFAGALNLFPNPVNRGEMVNLTLPAEGTVEVINVLGSTMKRVRMAEGSQLAADMAPGIYTIKVTDAEGNVFVDKLIIK